MACYQLTICIDHGLIAMFGKPSVTCGMMPRRGGKMEKHKEKSIFPLILILIGGVFILGAVLAIVFLPRAPQEAAQSSSSPANISEIARIQPEEAKIAFDSGEAVFVDVRPEESFAVSHIPGARSIPIAELPSRLDELDQKDWIIVY
jgi:hypothetical protein